MEAEGVVHALQRIHRSLADAGVLLDLHPEPTNSRAEVAREGRIEVVGELDEAEDIRDIRLARTKLELVEGQGFFRTERQIQFDMLEYFPSVEDWLEWRTEQCATSVIPKELLDKVQRLLEPAGSELIIREPIRASLLRRLAGD
jgi:hypothetical protein